MDSAILQQVFIYIFSFIYIYSVQYIIFKVIKLNEKYNKYDAPEIIYLLLQLKIQNTIFS